MKIKYVRKNDVISGICTNYQWYVVEDIHWQGDKIYVALLGYSHLILDSDEDVDVK